MKIIRNKYLTRIIGTDTELKLRTEKYDDIVGITDGVLPYELSLNGDNLIEFNDHYIGYKKLYEFADMSPKLYISSIYNASTKFELESAISERTVIKLNQLLGRLLIKDKNSNNLRFVTAKCRDCNLASLITRYIPIQNGFTEFHSIGLDIIINKILDDEEMQKLCDNIRVNYVVG